MEPSLFRVKEDDRGSLSESKIEINSSVIVDFVKSPEIDVCRETVDGEQNSLMDVVAASLPYLFINLDIKDLSLSSETSPQKTGGSEPAWRSPSRYCQFAK